MKTLSGGFSGFRGSLSPLRGKVSVTKKAVVKNRPSKPTRPTNLVNAHELGETIETFRGLKPASAF